MLDAECAAPRLQLQSVWIAPTAAAVSEHVFAGTPPASVSGWTLSSGGESRPTAAIPIPVSHDLQPQPLPRVATAAVRLTGRPLSPGGERATTERAPVEGPPFDGRRKRSCRKRSFLSCPCPCRPAADEGSCARVSLQLQQGVSRGTAAVGHASYSCSREFPEGLQL